MDGKKYRIVLVDDDVDVRTLYEDIIRNAGYEVISAIDGLDGLEKANQLPPDLVITGIIMPRMDGFMLYEALHKNVQTMNIPVMFLSHLGRQEDEIKARELGVKDFFITSLTPPHDIVSRIKALLDNSEFFVSLNPYELDAQKLAQELGLNRDFLCSDGGEKLAVRLRIKDARTRRFDAEIVCI